MRRLYRGVSCTPRWSMNNSIGPRVMEMLRDLRRSSTIDDHRRLLISSRSKVKAKEKRAHFRIGGWGLPIKILEGNDARPEELKYTRPTPPPLPIPPPLNPQSFFITFSISFCVFFKTYSIFMPLHHNMANGGVVKRISIRRLHWTGRRRSDLVPMLNWTGLKVIYYNRRWLFRFSSRSSCAQL